MEKISIYFTRSHSSITVQETASREVSARSMTDVVNNLSDEDRELVVRFAQAIIECANGDCKRITEW